MLKRMLLTALACGIAAGILLSVIQQAVVVPLLLEAESYEALSGGPSGAPEQSGPPASAATSPSLGRIAAAASSNLLVGLGFALLLTAAYALHGVPATALGGLIWGAAGYLVFSAAPALGLPPLPPGAVVADVVPRQIWWLGTVVATGTGLGLVAFARPLWLNFAAGFLIVLPHALGAPHAPADAASSLPEILAMQFTVASLATSAVFWLFLGGLSAWLYRRVP